MLSRRVALFLAGVTAAGALSGCSGSAGEETLPSPTPTPTTLPSPECPVASTSAVRWPAKVPADLPKPPGAGNFDSQTAQDGVFIVKFTTPMSLHDAVLFVVQKLPKAGYVLGRGDAEASEADAPFVRGNIRGLVRMLQVGLCQTQWLLATVDTRAQTTTPLLPTHSPSGSSSPLPFG